MFFVFSRAESVLIRRLVLYRVSTLSRDVYVNAGIIFRRVELLVGSNINYSIFN